jgi:GNAT superfamily N-acetyltransferase
MTNKSLQIRPASPPDIPTILGFIRALANYEKLAHEAVVTEELLREHLFGEHPSAEVILAEVNQEPVGFALFFTTYSTFVGKPGIWLEDLFVLPKARGAAVGKSLLKQVARIAVQRNCGRLEWSVLDWNEPAIGFYRKIGAVAMDQWTIQRMTGETLQKFAGED